MKTLSIIAAFALLAAAPLSAAGPAKVENFSLKDYNGKTVSLSDFKDAKAIVVLFIATKCPVSNAYNTRMASLSADYKGKGVVVVGINANKAESAPEVGSHAKEHGLDFAILKDVNNVIADRFEASVTPEAYVLNQSYDVLYHGRIDDSQREGNVQSRDLRAALDEILKGTAVSTASTKAFGCSIKRVK